MAQRKISKENFTHRKILVGACGGSQLYTSYIQACGVVTMMNIYVCALSYFGNYTSSTMQQCSADALHQQWSL